MISIDDKVIKEKEFVFEGNHYIARLYTHENKPMIYGEIVYREDNHRVHNMKGLARDFLKPYGIDVPTDAKKMVTHNTVALLIQKLEETNK
ncbi:MAG: hypothetical protein K5786_11325 [Treponema sp.]|nr:hypothetical protein [Treponema sp.]